MVAFTWLAIHLFLFGEYNGPTHVIICVYNFVAECPYEGQEMMDCVPLCQNTCSNVNVDSPCPEVCIRGCGCPGSMVLDENRGRCVRQSQCPNASK